MIMISKRFRLFSIVLVLIMLLSACGAEPAATGSEKVDLTFWYWAESDAPGADAWMTETVEAYKKVQPNVTVNVVPQSTDTLISAFQAAVTAGSGPDIASQWATGPVLGFVWQDALVPVSDYVSQDDVTPPENGRWTWDEFTAACDKLKAAGITPFGIGDKNGYGGAWWFANVGIQGLNSTEDLRQAIIGNKPFTDEMYTGWYARMDDMVKKGYFNPDVMSLDLDQGVRQFWEGKAAMAFGTDGMIKQALTDVGEDKVGVMQTPKWGTAKLADVGNATQSISFLITKWSKHPQEAADFLKFMHTAERLTSWYKHTGVIAADARFDRTLVTSPALKQMMEWETTGPQVWLENFLPGQIDSDADLTAGQTIFAKSGSQTDVANLWQSV